MTGQCPVKVKQAAYKIGNQNTEFLIADYGSICFVQITQVKQHFIINQIWCPDIIIEF